MTAVAAKLGIGTTETLHKRVCQDQSDNGARSRTTTEESAQIKAMKKEIAELKRANETLKAVASFFAADLERPHTLVAFIDEHPDRFGGVESICRRPRWRTASRSRRHRHSGAPGASRSCEQLLS